jgi:hypothetical protein
MDYGKSHKSIFFYRFVGHVESIQLMYYDRLCEDCNIDKDLLEDIIDYSFNCVIENYRFFKDNDPEIDDYEAIMEILETDYYLIDDIIWSFLDSVSFELPISITIDYIEEKYGGEYTNGFSSIRNTIECILGSILINIVSDILEQLVDLISTGVPLTRETHIELLRYSNSEFNGEFQRDLCEVYLELSIKRDEL